LYRALEAYPVQMCHFHQKRIIQRYITKHPKLQASKDLQKIMYKLTSTNETIFIKKLDVWHETYKDFLNEKTLNESTGKESFTHAKLVSAYKSLRTNLPYLFTYKKYKYLNMGLGLEAISNDSGYTVRLLRKAFKEHSLSYTGLEKSCISTKKVITGPDCISGQ